MHIRSSIFENTGDKTLIFPINIYYVEGDRIEDPGEGYWDFSKELVGLANNQEEMKILVARYILTELNLNEYEDLPTKLKSICAGPWYEASENYRNTFIVTLQYMTHKLHKEARFITEL